MLNSSKRQALDSPSKQPRQGKGTTRDENIANNQTNKKAEGERGSSQSYFKKFSPLRLAIQSPYKKLIQKQIDKNEQMVPVANDMVNNSSPFANLTNQQSPSQNISVFEPI